MVGQPSNFSKKRVGMLRTAALSMVVAFAVLGLKFAAYAMTGSIALYSDALESLINVVTACGALLALHISNRPPDAGHPYGHSKAEYFSAVLEGVLIVLASVSILREAYLGIQRPPLEASGLGLAIGILATVLNALWASRLLQAGKRWSSPALEADGKHLRSDVITSVAVLLGLLLSWLTRNSLVDSAVAALAALSILWSGSRLVRDSIDGLMDKAASADVIARVRQLIATHGAGALEAHDLRTRHAGHMTFIEFHLIVPGTMLVAEAHAICDRIEDGIEQELEGSVVSIHIEPEGKAKLLTQSPGR